MANRAFTFALAMLLAAIASPAAARCMLCGPAEATPTVRDERPLVIEVETTLDFSRLGLAAPGAEGIAIIDPETGVRHLDGGLVDMGGVPLHGTVTVRGEPNRHLVVSLPAAVTMVGSDGETLELANLSTNLKNNPKLGPDGRLQFGFGGRLRVSGRADGEYRGRIPITIDYRDDR